MGRASEDKFLLKRNVFSSTCHWWSEECDLLVSFSFRLCFRRSSGSSNFVDLPGPSTPMGSASGRSFVHWSCELLHLYRSRDASPLGGNYFFAPASTAALLVTAFEAAGSSSARRIECHCTAECANVTQRGRGKKGPHDPQHCGATAGIARHQLTARAADAAVVAILTCTRLKLSWSSRSGLWSRQPATAMQR